MELTEFLARFVDILTTVLSLAILARVIVSWIPVGENSAFAPLVRMIYQTTEPILAPIRSILPNTGMFDLSPMIAIIVLMILRNVAGRLF